MEELCWHCSTQQLSINKEKKKGELLPGVTHRADSIDQGGEGLPCIADLISCFNWMHIHCCITVKTILGGLKLNWNLYTAKNWIPRECFVSATEPQANCGERLFSLFCLRLHSRFRCRKKALKRQSYQLRRLLSMIKSRVIWTRWITYWLTDWTTYTFSNLVVVHRFGRYSGFHLVWKVVRQLPVLWFCF